MKVLSFTEDDMQLQLSGAHFNAIPYEEGLYVD